MKEMHEEIKKVGDVLSKLAEMRGDYRVLDQRVLAVEKHVDELRRGDGWIEPNQRSAWMANTREPADEMPLSTSRSQDWQVDYACWKQDAKA